MPAETVSDNVETLINLALAEDFGPGDVTSTYFVPEHLTARAILTPRKKGVLSGVNVAAEVFRKVDPSLKVEVYLHDGEAVAPGAVVMLIEGSARSILGAERTALNFIQRLSGVATLTRKYVKAVSHTSARILDTRKTTPGYRLLEKAAVAHGGGTNHRMGLYDRAMVKDNHLMTDGNTEHLAVHQQAARGKARRGNPAGSGHPGTGGSLPQAGRSGPHPSGQHDAGDAEAGRRHARRPRHAPDGSQRGRQPGHGGRHCGIRRGLRFRGLRHPLRPLPGPGAGFQRGITLTFHPIMDLSNFREEYLKGQLHRKDLAENPFEQFQTWFEQALKADIPEPNAFSLATVNAHGRPSLRTVLLKYFDQTGFVFFTNYGSHKAHDIEENPQVCMMLPWVMLERQVIIYGKAVKVSRAESLKYFLTRPKESQLGAWVSQQSSVISGRKLLEMKLMELKNKFSKGEIPLPSFWGGYRIIPDTFEFWQGGPGRVHDRFMYKLQENGSWTIERLQP